MTGSKPRRKPTPPKGFSRHRDLGALQTLLLTACPPAKDGRVSIPVLAKRLGVSNQYVYKWINEGKVPPAYVTKIVTLGEGRVELEQFHPYVFI